MPTVTASSSPTPFASKRLATDAPVMIVAGDLRELADVAREYLALHPAFRQMPLGAPNSFARAEQDAEISVEDRTRAILAKVEKLLEAVK